MKISLLESVRIPDGVTELPCDVFGHCKTLQTVEHPNGINLHSRAFQDSPKIKIVCYSLQKKRVK